MWRVSNGGTWPENVHTFATATLGNGATLVIANNITDVPGADEYTTGFCTWNGDDAVGLAKDNGMGTFELLDAVGTDGPDPGSGWNVAGVTNATRDHRLTRKDSICQPNTNWALSAGTDANNSEWVVVAYTTGAANAGHTTTCSSSCPLFTTLNDPICADSTEGLDTFTVTLDYTGGNQGGGTYTITPAFMGPHPDTTAAGTLTFTGIEGTNIVISITSTGCTINETAVSPSCLIPPNIVINEILADPDPVNGDANGDGAVNTTQDEFVEIVNADTITVDLSGWTISDGSQIRHVFSNGLSLMPGEFATVFAGGIPTGIPGAFVETASTTSLSLNNGGDAVALRDSFGNLVATYSYGAEGGNNVALGRNPDITGPFVAHNTIPIPGRLFSPGDSNLIISNCPLGVVVGSPLCDTVTAANDSFTVNVNFFGGGQGLGTYTLSPMNMGDNPDTLVTGTLTFKGVEGTDLVIQITSMDCTITDTVSAPECEIPPAIVINEFLADPDAILGDANGDSTVSTSQDEFIELVNNDTVTADISGWTIEDGFASRHTFPDSTFLEPDSFATVFGGGMPTGIPGSIVQTASGGFLSLNNGGDDIVIKDAFGNVVTSYTYGNEGGNNEALGRNPDISGLFVAHSSIPATGRLFSPGGLNLTGTPCPIVISVDTAYCLSSTLALDDYVVEVSYTGGGQGLGTYTISPAFTGDNPDTVAAGTMIFTLTECDNFFFSIESVDCSLNEFVPSPACVVELPCAQPGDIILTEFMANPNDTADSFGEYFEFYNRSDDTFDLFGYELFDNGIGSHIISCSVPILPGEIKVFGVDPDIPNVDYIYPSDFFLSNGNDEIFLRCLDSVGPILITGVDYSDGDPFGAGVALELNCVDNAGPVFGDEDFVPATDLVNLDADPAEDFGSPGSLGNTDTVSAVATELQVANAPEFVADGIPFFVTICATDSAGVTPCVYNDYIVLEQVDGIIATITNDSVQPVNACATFELLVPALSDCDTMVFDARSNGLMLDSALVIEVRQLIHFEPFTCGMETWSIANVDSFSTWGCDTLGGYYEMNAFGDDTNTVANDWIISPELDLTVHTGIALTFRTRERFDGPPLQLLLSTDYSGTGDPNLASWTTIPFNFDASQNGFAFGPWTSSGAIALDSLGSPSTYIALQYTGFPDDSVANWLVDDVIISGCPKMCSIDTVVVDSITTCDPSNNLFYADVTVAYSDAPVIGYLVLSGDATDSVDVTSMVFQPDSGVYVFDSVAFNSDGGLKTITASFTRDSTCSFTAADINGTDIAPCATGATVFGGLVINEVWNDASFSGSTCFSNEAFIELIVVASLDEDTTAQFINLQNWIIEPSADASDPGHIRIKTGCLTNVPVGALVVIYNADNVPTGIAGPDETDADSNLVYFIPSNSACLEYTTDATYPGTTYVDGPASGCTHAFQISAIASSIPYDVQTRHPHAFNRTYSNIYDDLTYSPSNIITPGGSSIFTCGNIDDGSAVLDDQTISPGLPNTATNGSLIDAIRKEAGNVLPLSNPSIPNPFAISYYDFLTPGLTPTCGEVVLPDCQDTLIVVGPVMVSDTLSAAVRIETNGAVTINASAVFDAPEILLQPGFEVPLGAEFTTLLVGCSPSALNSAGGTKKVISTAELKELVPSILRPPK